MRKRFSQGKKGFLFLAVELIKALKRASLPTNESRFFNALIALTKGWGRVFDFIRLPKFYQQNQ